MDGHDGTSRELTIATPSSRTIQFNDNALACVKCDDVGWACLDGFVMCTCPMNCMGRQTHYKCVLGRTKGHVGNLK